ncbi:MAG: ParB/RepB/Spo0J family partition protein [Candidatus Glassbacteria bacterium]
MNIIEVRTEDLQEAPFLGLLSYGRDYGWLEESIERCGLLYPLIVSPGENGSYSLVCGRARLGALTALQAQTVPAIVRTDLKGDKSFEVAIEDNLKTRGFNEVEKAGAVHFILKVLKPPREEAERLLSILSVPINPRTVSRYLKLYNASDTVKQMLASGELSFHTFVLISGLNENETGPILRVVKKLGLGTNYQRELVTLCEDISACRGGSVSEILSSPEVRDMLGNDSLSAPDKVKHIFRLLRNVRCQRAQGPKTGGKPSIGDRR